MTLLLGDKGIGDEIGLNKILTFIQKHKGLDVSSYRQNFIHRRLRLRVLATRVKSPQEYIALIEKSPEEFNLFLDALSINVTEFFRDPDVYDAFRKLALTELMNRKAASDYKSIRIWSSACASGEEAYSLAILLKEELKGRQDLMVKVLATDIDDQALEKAKEATYRTGDLQKLPPAILKKYFTLSNAAHYQVNDDIRQMVKFQKHNIFGQAPYKGLDAIFCRNIMIYLSRPQMMELFKKFYELLNPQGYLILGKVETLWERNLFKPVDLKAKIYQKPG